MPPQFYIRFPLIFYGSLDIALAAYRDIEQSSCGGLDRIACGRSATALRNDNGINGRAVGRARYSSKITGIRYAVEHHYHRGLPLFIKLRDEVVELMIAYRRQYRYRP